MAVPTPTTQTAGAVVAAATINSQGNLATYLAGRTESGGARKPFAVLRQTVAQTLTSGTPAAVTFDAEDVDYDNGHSTTTNTSRYTAGTAGWHDVGYGADLSNGTGTTVRQAYLRTNGTTVVPNSSTSSAGPAQIAATRPVFLNVGDYVELIVVQSTGGSVITGTGSQSGSWMSVEWRSV